MSEAQKKTHDQGANPGLYVSTADGDSILLEGDVLTAPGRSLQIADEHRDLFAYVTSGARSPARLLVAKGKKYDSYVATFKLKLQKDGHPLDQNDVVQVEIDTLKKIYQAAAETSSKSGRHQQNEETEAKFRRILIQIIHEAAAEGASDIHIQANDNGAQIEFRIDGMLTKKRQVTTSDARSVMATAFAMASVSDPTYTQSTFQNASIIDVDGQLGLPKRVQSLRLQWNPTMLGGRYAVMRLFYTSNESRAGLEQLGFAKHHLKQFSDMRQRSTGIVVISGPTGSGKSTTLQKCLTTLLREKPQKNLLTVEDPPEYRIPGAKQMQVVNATTADDRSAKFIQAIMASLRSDPDIIMIGEIRDLESARLAYDAANTGHAVWTSLHANNAVAIIGRLLDLGLEPWKVTDTETIIGLVAQRLVPKLCPHCKVPLDKTMPKADGANAPAQAPKDARERAIALAQQAQVSPHQFHLYGQNPKGCDKCRGQGIVGRTVAAEIVQPDETFMQLCREHRRIEARAHWISKGGISLMAHGFMKVVMGEISPYHLEDMANVLEWDDSMNGMPTRILQELEAREERRRLEEERVRAEKDKQLSAVRPKA